MKMALIADVHANAPALEAVLAAIAREGVEGVVCLGDIVGYNAMPEACVASVRQYCTSVVLGNHDADVAQSSRAAGTSAEARTVQDWTRDHLSADAHGYLRSLPNKVVASDLFVAVHGCYLNDWHVTGYVTGTMLEANLHAIVRHDGWPKIGFCGHTHIPMAGWLEGDRCVEAPPNASHRWPATARAVLVNPGSVGQPRDGDPRAAFAIIDIAERKLVFHRVQYDIAETSDQILAAGLPQHLAERLWNGR